jgi:hypothetical protein
MNFSTLERRLKVIEMNASKRSTNKNCICRQGQRTIFHTAADLEKIIAIICPTHGFRDLGDLLWVASGTPLRKEDRLLCSCPTSPTRDWLEGKRGLLTPKEQEEECRSWEEEDLSEGFRIERVRVNALLHKYLIVKRRYDEEMQRHN